MEKLSQKFMLYFYITLVVSIVLQLINTIVISLKLGAIIPAIALIMMSIVNLIILDASLLHNIKQQFIGSKAMAKVLVFTLPLLLICQIVLNSAGPMSMSEVISRITTLSIAEIALIYRIKTIDELEIRANKYSEQKKRIANQKGE